MSQKNIAAVLLLVATALGGPPAVKHAIDVQEQVVEDVAVTGPSDCVVGELIELSINGNRPSWLVPVEDHRVNGNTVLVSFREDGEYEFVASAIASGTTAIVRHVVTVGTPEPVSVLVPDPKPPVPEPSPSVTVSLTDIVVGWCVESNAPPEACKQIGDNFIDAATDADSIDDLLSRLSKANRKVNQKGCEQVLAQIQQYLFDNLAGKDLEAHRCAFDEIGTGLSAYAKNASPAGDSEPNGLWK